MNDHATAAQSRAMDHRYEGEAELGQKLRVQTHGRLQIG
jgi:hypothetical protein